MISYEIDQTLHCLSFGNVELHSLLSDIEVHSDGSSQKSQKRYSVKK
jgi:hypothetical protein